MMKLLQIIPPSLPLCLYACASHSPVLFLSLIINPPLFALFSIFLRLLFRLCLLIVQPCLIFLLSFCLSLPPVSVFPSPFLSGCLSPFFSLFPSFAWLSFPASVSVFTHLFPSALSPSPCYCPLVSPCFSLSPQGFLHDEPLWRRSVGLWCPAALLRRTYQRWCSTLFLRDSGVTPTCRNKQQTESETVWSCVNRLCEGISRKHQVKGFCEGITGTLTYSDGQWTPGDRS